MQANQIPFSSEGIPFHFETDIAQHIIRIPPALQHSGVIAIFVQRRTGQVRSEGRETRGSGGSWLTNPDCQCDESVRVAAVSASL